MHDCKGSQRDKRTFGGAALCIGPLLAGQIPLSKRFTFQAASDAAAAVDFHGDAGDHCGFIGTEKTGGIAHVLGSLKDG